ncbi:MAG: NTP transferase domain-containing protein [Acidobacteria bacterium]|nr:NTP transferase domain-containing protein [Acidobacteriota bacterium]
MSSEAKNLGEAASLSADRILNPERLGCAAAIDPGEPVLVLLAAGKGTRFGQAPKCAQPVCGVPLARHTIDAFRGFSSAPVICVVGYRHEEVAAALGDDNIYVLSGNPVGGTAFAAFEALGVPGLIRENAILMISMGDRVVTAPVFRKLRETHLAGAREADLTFLTAVYEPPKNRGKGRIVRDADRKVLGIVEQRDIDAIADPRLRSALDDLTEGNCPLYVIRARTFHRHAGSLNNNNAQRQYYLTDIIESIHREGGEIRTVTTTVADPEYDLLTSDVTVAVDLALLEGILKSSEARRIPAVPEIAEAARTIRADRPPGQVASIARQLEELRETAIGNRLGFKDDQPVAIGISGGRLRIAFMHPDMGRFYGPAWQMPIGARDSSGREQIVLLAQCSDDQQIHLYPTNPEFREKLESLASDMDCMYPGEDVVDWYSYEGFGTRMAENLLLALGYFTDAELQRRRENRQPLPPPSLWVSTSMRRPFSLIGNAIASLRTVRKGNLGARVQAVLGRDRFRGLRLVSTGNIPRGGFSSSSAVTVATKNAINALFDLGISPDLMVHLSCQAEYGTGVRAGSLDQATEQKGRPGQGTLISSNPRDNYRIIGTYPVPSSRFKVLFPYTVDRDRAAWEWSAGTYSADPEPGRQTTAEMRKMTGKAAELAAILLQLPLDTDFFKQIEADLVSDGRLSRERTLWVCDALRKIPLLITQEEIRRRVYDRRQWYIEQLAETEKIDLATASEKTDAAFSALFAGWRDPLLRRAPGGGKVVEERGVPLRATVAYLFGEVAKNFRLIHHPDEWIECVSLSQLGDRCFEINPDRLPRRDEMLCSMEWERAWSGPKLMEQWLERCGALPFDFNHGLDDASLSAADPAELHRWRGTNFFRGLALIDLAEAMLKRSFGSDAVAVRVNAAGQGDFFQVHVDTSKAPVEEVKQFIRVAFYRRFGLTPEQEFVETHPGGGAVGVRLSRFDLLPELIRALG